MGRRAFDQSADDEEMPSSEKEPDCVSSLFANISCLGALAEKFILHQCHDYHVVSFAGWHLIRERNSSAVAFFSASQAGRFFFAAASPSSKSVKGSHGSVLVAPRNSLQPGAMAANVDDHKVEWRGHDCVACVVKAVRASYVHVTAYMTSTADARCPENVSKLRQISGLLLKQRREFTVAAGWNMVLE